MSSFPDHVAVDEDGDSLHWRLDIAKWMKDMYEEIGEVDSADYHEASGMEETRELHRKSYRREFIRELLEEMGEPLPDKHNKTDEGDSP